MACHPEVVACTEELISSAKGSIACLNEAAEQYEVFARDLEMNDLILAAESGKKAVETLDEHVQIFGRSLVEVNKIQDKLSRALNERTGDLHVLDTKHQALQQKVEDENLQLTNLSQRRASALENLKNVEADLELSNAQLEKARQAQVELIASNKRQEEEQVKIADIWTDRRVELDKKEAELRDSHNQQMKRQEELKNGFEAHDEREAKLREGESSATRIFHNNNRDRLALDEALASLRVITGRFNRYDDTLDGLSQDAKGVAAMVKTEILGLNERIKLEHDLAQEHSQRADRWFDENNNRMDELKELEKEITSREDAIQHHLRTIHRQKNQMQEDLGCIQGLRLNIDSLTTSNADHRREVEQLNSKVETLCLLSKAQAQELTLVKNERKERKAKLNDLECENQMLMTLTNQQAEYLQQRKDASLTELAEAKSELATKQQRIDEIEILHKTSATDLAAVKEQLASEQENAEESLTHREQLEQEIEGLLSQLTVIETSLKTEQENSVIIKAKLEAAEAGEKDLITQLTEAKKLLTAAEQEAARTSVQSREDYERCHREKQAVGVQLGEAQQNLKDLQQKMSVLKDELKSKAGELLSVQQESTKQAASLEAWHTTAKSLSATCDIEQTQKPELSQDPEAFGVLMKGVLDWFSTEGSGIIDLCETILPDRPQREYFPEAAQIVTEWGKKAIMETQDMRQTIAKLLKANQGFSRAEQQLLEKDRKKQREIDRLQQQSQVKEESYKAELLALTQEQDRAQEKNKSKDDEVSTLWRQLQQLRAKEKLDQAALKDITKDRDELQRRVSAGDDQLTKLQEQLQQFQAIDRSTLSIVEQERDRYRLLYESSQVEVQQKLREICDIQDQIQAKEESHQAKLSYITKQLHRSREEHQSSQDLAQAKANKVVQLESQLDRLSQENDSLTTDLSNVNGEHGRLQLKLNASDAASKVQGDKVNSLQERLKDLNKSCSEVCKERTKIKETLSRTERDLQASENRNVALQRELEEQRQARMVPPSDKNLPKRKAAANSDLVDHDDVTESRMSPPSKRRRSNKASQSASRVSNQMIEHSRIQTSDDGDDDFIDIRQLRDRNFTYGGLPTALFHRIRQQMEKWDSIRSNWMQGTSAGDPRCAHRFANRNASGMEEGQACAHCVKNKFVCLAVRKNQLQIQALPSDIRGQATKDEMAYWVVESQESIT
ncbi:MAG: hypothetical protein Q9166_007654 [cf. Caloplaca sp. 2 TL-2023]